MEPGDFVFSDRQQVRRADVDAQATVFNAHYLTYFDTAFTHYWRALALPCDALAAALGGSLRVRKADLEFGAPARMNDWLDVSLRCSGIGSSSVTMEAVVFRARQPLTVGTLTYVCADLQTGRARALPPLLRDALESFERREPVLRVQTGSWADLGVDAHALRDAVFVQEQGISSDDEWDAADAGALHAVAFNGLGQPVATGRLLRDDGVGHIGRVAVVRSLRGAGHGLTLMNALEHAARERGVKALRLNAQASAAAFYERLGYVAEGAPFEEVGIPHVSMRKALAAHSRA